MRYFVVLLILSLSLIGFAGPSKKVPSWFDRNIAGYSLQYDEKHGQTFIQDPKSGFFIIRTIDCDGAHVSLTLTRDRKIAQGYGVDYVKKALPSLATGKGVKIGDSQTAVRKKLGHPTKTARTGDRKQYVEYRYEWHDVKNGEGHDWANIFTFRDGKLVEIWFTREMFPGEGD